MPKNKKTRTAIYHPPKSGMPYLVVTVSPEGVTATAVESKEEGSNPRLKEDNDRGFQTRKVKSDH